MLYQLTAANHGQTGGVAGIVVQEVKGSPAIIIGDPLCTRCKVFPFVDFEAGAVLPGMEMKQGAMYDPDEMWIVPSLPGYDGALVKISSDFALPSNRECEVLANCWGPEEHLLLLEPGGRFQVVFDSGLRLNYEFDGANLHSQPAR